MMQQMLLGAQGPLAITMSGSFSNVSGSSPVTTVASASGRGGIGAYTYLWEWTSGPSPAAITIVSPTAAATTLSAVLGPDESTGGTIRCTITDSVGNFVQASASVNLSRTP
jgi:hypothetical protein